MKSASSLALSCGFLVACAGQLLTDGGSGSHAATTPPSDAGASSSSGGGGASSSTGGGGASSGPSDVVGAVPGDVCAVAMDDLNLYLAAAPTIYRLAKDGAGGPEALATTDNFACGIAVDGTNVYWTDLCGTDPNCTSGSVRSVPKAGGTVATLASGQSRPWGITVDDTNVYWTNQGHDGGDDVGLAGQVVSLAKTGGTPLVLVDGLELAQELVLDGDGVIFHAFNTVGRVPKTGGAVTTLDSRQGGFFTTNLVVSGGQLYYWAGDGVGALVSVATDANDTGPPSDGPFGTVLAQPPEPNALALWGEMLFWNHPGWRQHGANHEL